ncbi:heterogeneous nuclear ribonucleoprotein Q-like protein, partial [Euroglyphus maynei]
SLPDDRKKNRGFCFLEFDSHKNASAAKRKLTTTGMKIFKSDILVDWADPQEEPDEETMSKVKVLYVRNLTSDVSENELKELFEEYGPVERVKKIKDYAFVHFEDRQQALNAMNNLNGKEFGGSSIEISLAKPPSDRKKKEEVLRNHPNAWNPLMFYDPSDWWYGASNRAGPHHQFNFPCSNVPPNAAAVAATQWNAYGLTNGGQMPPTMPPYCPTNANGPQNNNRRNTNGTAGPNGQAAAAAAAAAAMMNAAATGTVLASSNNGNGHSMSNPSNRKWRGKSNQNNTTLINSNNINKRQ